MRALMAFVALVAALAFVPTVPARADGCYLCEGGGYVRYRGSDTFAKRKKAREKCGCKVTGTTSRCTNPKCTVSVMGLDLRPLVGRVQDRLDLRFDLCD